MLPLAGLAWLAWAIVEQDRVSEHTRIAERREQALGVATASLQRTLAEIEERLTVVASGTGDVRAEAGTFAKRSGAAFAVLERRGLITRGGTFLPFYPASAATELPSSPVFVRADQEEFTKHDPAAAIAVLQPLAHSQDLGIRAGVLLRMARNHRKSGDTLRALATYDALAALEEAPAGGLPAGLAARQGRALLLEADGRTKDLRREAATLLLDLDEGRWPLTRQTYDFARTQALGWIGGAGPIARASDRLALADAVDGAWRIWLTSLAAAASDRQRRLVRTAYGSALVLTRTSPGRLAVLVAGQRFLQDGWLADVRPPGTDTDVDFALTDGDGEPVIGRTDGPVALQSVRTASLTSLPWTVHAITTRSSRSGLSRTAQLSLAAVALTALMLVLSAYLISRALARELSVAALQSDFVAAVSHEFRSPLTTIRQLSELLTRGRVSSDDRRQQFYETLLRESERLHRLIESLLDFGRMEARGAEYRFDRLDPEPFLREVVIDFQQQIADGFVVDLRVRGPLPPIRADRGSLSRVLWNLLDNAAKYSPEHRAVQVDVERSGAHVLVHVRDQGIGIPPHEQASIFDKFVRGAHARLASIKGTGLGLAMASRIVEAHGGTIKVESRVGVGSTFTVLLPIMEHG